jgi:hypothetical protein
MTLSEPITYIWLDLPYSNKIFMSLIYMVCIIYHLNYIRPLLVLEKASWFVFVIVQRVKVIMSRSLDGNCRKLLDASYWMADWVIPWQDCVNAPEPCCGGGMLKMTPREMQPLLAHFTTYDADELIL